MVTINERKFYEVPCMCGCCPFYLGNGKMKGGKQLQSGFCILFDKKKPYYGALPKRCSGLFGKAMTYPDGTNLVLVAKE